MHFKAIEISSLSKAIRMCVSELFCYLPLLFFFCLSSPSYVGAVSGLYGKKKDKCRIKMLKNQNEDDRKKEKNRKEITRRSVVLPQ